MANFLLHFQQLRNGLLSLNVAIPALKMIHVKDVQKSATTPEITEQVPNMVLDDWQIKVREIAETIGISKERVGYILHALRKMGAALADIRQKTHSHGNL